MAIQVFVPVSQFFTCLPLGSLASADSSTNHALLISGEWSHSTFSMKVQGLLTLASFSCCGRDQG